MARLTYCVYVIFIFIGCSDAGKKESLSDTEKVDIGGVIFRQDASLSADSWTCMQFNFNRLCHPKDWKVRDTNTQRILFDLGPTHSKDEYLVVLHYPMTGSQSIDVYFGDTVPVFSVIWCHW